MIARLTRPLAVLAVAIAALAALTGPAAAVTDDTVLFDGVEVNFGLDASSNPVLPGILAWDWDASQNGWNPRLWGFLTVDGMNPNTTCARVKVSYYDGSHFLTSRTSDELCPSTWGVHAALIDMRGYTDVRIDKVVISFQSGSGNSWFGWSKTRLLN